MAKRIDKATIHIEADYVTGKTTLRSVSYSVGDTADPEISYAQQGASPPMRELTPAELAGPVQALIDTAKANAEIAEGIA